MFVADPELLAARAQQLGLKIQIQRLERVADAQPHHFGHCQVLPQPLNKAVVAGTTDVANAAYVLACLDRTIAACNAGEADAMVTGPINKAVINAAGTAFSGHTEYIAERSGNHQPIMMLQNGPLRVALVTTHLPLAAVPAAINFAKLAQTIQITHKALVTQFGIKQPRVGVCGLNPHAGESGHLGMEEIDTIAPCLVACRERGLDVVGPIPADTIFAPGQRENFDAIIAMYHDQGLAALKALGFGHSVNVTLGLPVTRTSVDHGTALDLAGSGKADSGSLEAAIELASRLVQVRRGD